MNRVWIKIEDMDTLLVPSFEKLQQNLENLQMKPPPLMPIVSTLLLLPLGSQPTAQKFENNFSYAIGSPPINTRTQART